MFNYYTIILVLNLITLVSILITLYNISIRTHGKFHQTVFYLSTGFLFYGVNIIIEIINKLQDPFFVIVKKVTTLITLLVILLGLYNMEKMIKHLDGEDGKKSKKRKK